jgi:hypothetical protein
VRENQKLFYDCQFAMVVLRYMIFDLYEIGYTYQIFSLKVDSMSMMIHFFKIINLMGW